MAASEAGRGWTALCATIGIRQLAKEFNVLGLIGIIAFVIAIMFSIAWHELGHLMWAKRFGVKCTQYMIGFGPSIWSTNRGETEYGLKAIPFGGYVRMIGMFPPGPDGSVKSSSTGRLGVLIDDARRQAQQELVTEDDRRRAFYRLPVRQKIVVMLGGPVMNLILAFILFAVVLVGFGVPTQQLKVDEVSACSPTATSQSTTCEPGKVPSPAAVAGLQAGDVVVAFNGQPVDSWSQFSSQVRSSPAGPATVTVDRGGRTLVLTTNIQVMSRAVVKDGEPTGEMAPQGFFGMAPTTELEPQPISAVPARMWDLTSRSAMALLTFPARLVGVAQTTFGGEQRDPNSPVSIVGAGRISGDFAAAEDYPVSWRVAQILGLIAVLNLFLFLFNLIPLLPLDGGHVAGALWEGLRRQIAKVRHRPDPGYVDVARALPLAYAVTVVLIGASVLLIYADLVNPIRLGG